VTVFGLIRKGGAECWCDRYIAMHIKPGSSMPMNVERDVGSTWPEPASVRNEEARPSSRLTISYLLATPGIEDIEFEINRSKELAKPANLLD
jgi:hypothetical protein